MVFFSAIDHDRHNPFGAPAMTWKNGMLFLAAAAMIAGAILLTNRESAQGQVGGGKGGMGGGARYTVVETQAHNLLVTDNGTNTLYYYTADKDAKVGADLKLRGSIDLSQVGTDVVKIKTAIIK
jgi:hypothetical protein